MRPKNQRFFSNQYSEIQIIWLKCICIGVGWISCYFGKLCTKLGAKMWENRAIFQFFALWLWPILSVGWPILPAAVTDIIGRYIGIGRSLHEILPLVRFIDETGQFVIINQSLYIPLILSTAFLLISFYMWLTSFSMKSKLSMNEHLLSLL